MGELKEKCAVVGVANANPDLHTAGLVYEGLLTLQHRGQEASGIASIDSDGLVDYRRALGYVSDVFDAGSAIKSMYSSAAIGHNRYATNGKKDAHPQPVIDRVLGFALAHNGNLPVTKHMAERVGLHGISQAGLNDSELMSHTVATLIRDGHELGSAVRLATPLFVGAYACTAMHRDQTIAFRDPYGIRPLSMGQLADTTIFASETCALEAVDAEGITDINPGELVIADGTGFERSTFADPIPKLDIFEMVYFARPDSILCGQRVSEVRRRFGERLALEHPPITERADNIIVLPVPDTSTPAAEGYADALGLRHAQGIIKDRYSASGRSFIQPDEGRDAMLRRKHSFIPERVAGKDVIIIDDSIVRGNTLPRLVEQAKRNGARTVTCLIASPPVRFPDFYGIDTPSQDELIAVNLTIEQMREFAGCDYLGFLSLKGMIEATGINADQFNISAFTGDYPIDIGEYRKTIKTPVSMEFAE